MVKNLYRFFLQNSHQLEQTVLTIKNGEVFLKEVPALSRITAKDLRKPDTPASTLAYFDAMTCEARDIAEFLDALRVPLYKFNLQKTHIGYFYDSRLRRLKPVTDDSLLQGIASRADGNELGHNDRDAYDFIYDFIHRLEENDSEFVPQLIKTAKASDGFKSYDLSVPENLIGYIIEYHNGMISNSQGYYSLALAADLDECKSDIVKSMKSYKNFREIYRFTKSYDLAQEKVKEQKAKEELQFAARKVSSPKQKSLGTYPDQLTLFDYLEGQK